MLERNILDVAQFEVGFGIAVRIAANLGSLVALGWARVLLGPIGTRRVEAVGLVGRVNDASAQVGQDGLVAACAGVVGYGDPKGF